MMNLALLSFCICASALRLNRVQDEGAETTMSCDSLQEHAVNNTVVFTTLDIADDYTSMIKNYACGVRRVGLPLLIWSVSEKTHSKMVEFGFPDVYPKDTNMKFVKPFGKEYMKTVHMKPATMQAVLNCGFDVLYLDSDLGIASNPLSYFQAHKGDVQISTNYPQHHMNTGVMYIRNSPQTHALMTEWTTQIKKGACKGFACGDQEVLSNLMRKKCGGFSVKEKEFFAEESKSTKVNCAFSEGGHELQMDLLPPGKFANTKVTKFGGEVFTYHPNFSGLKHALNEKEKILKHHKFNGKSMWCHDK